MEVHRGCSSLALGVLGDLGSYRSRNRGEISFEGEPSRLEFLSKSPESPRKHIPSGNDQQFAIEYGHRNSEMSNQNGAFPQLYASLPEGIKVHFPYVAVVFEPIDDLNLPIGSPSSSGRKWLWMRPSWRWTTCGDSWGTSG